MRARVHCDDVSGGRGKGLTPAVHRLRALDLICRLDAAATASHRQPSKRDLIEACAHRLIAVLSAHPAGACHPPQHGGRWPSPPSHTPSRRASPSGPTPPATSTPPTPRTTPAAPRPPPASPTPQ